MPFMDPQRHIPTHHVRSPMMNQAIRRVSDQQTLLMSRVQLPQYPPHGEMFPGCHPGLVNGGIVMRPALPHIEKEQPYPTGLHSLSPGEAEALYNCMDPKLWAESMLNPMMLPPMFDSYYNGLDFHAPGYRKNVTKETTGPLKAWLQDHRKNPYPTKAEKIMLAIITKMTLTQVSTWFANARRRLKKETGRSSPDVEEDESRGLSEDEGEGSDISHSKHDSDQDDDCEEISVDDDDNDQVDQGDSHRLGGIGRISDTSASGNKSRLLLTSRDFSEEPARHSIATLSKQTVEELSRSNQLSDYAVAATSSASKIPLNELNKHNLSPEVSLAEVLPVDLSQSQDSSRNSICPQQRQQSHQRADDNTNHNPVNNPVTPKAKIWSISNILSLESAEQST